jgi:holo-[acyl-carrier protein] synthase
MKVRPTVIARPRFARMRHEEALMMSRKRPSHAPSVHTSSSAGPIQVGIDVVSVRDVARSLARFGDRYVRRGFTAKEAAYCRAAVGRVAAARFAVRFAAKEAVLKALRPEAPSGNWRSIEVRRHASGSCDVVLHGKAAALAARQGVETLSLSMSHHAGHATAVVVAQVAARTTHQEF